MIVLVSDSLMRWYADEGKSRALWMSTDEVSGGQMSELGDSPKFYGHVAATFEQVSHFFVGGDEMPLRQLSSFIEDVLDQAGRS